MGELARVVQERIRDGLEAARPAFEWTVEYPVAGTPVDVAGVGRPANDAGGGSDAGQPEPAVGTLALVELEWRRADPADNAATLFRTLDAGDLDADRVVVAQVFTGYYDLASGGVSTKRENAEFVGRVAADTYGRVSYRPVDLAVDPPKRGGDLPDGWRTSVDDAVARIADPL